MTCVCEGYWMACVCELLGIVSVCGRYGMVCVYVGVKEQVMALALTLTHRCDEGGHSNRLPYSDHPLGGDRAWDGLTVLPSRFLSKPFKERRRESHLPCSLAQWLSLRRTGNRETLQ